MTERRDKTSAESIDFSFAADNVERGEPDADFIKRRVTYAFGDNPRGREINFRATTTDEAYGSTRNPVFRAYRGKAPLGGQSYESPVRAGQLPGISDLRVELPSRSVATAALDAAKVVEREALEASNFAAIFPTVTLDSPAPGVTFSPGDQVTIRATVASISTVFAATLEVDGQAVDRRALDRRDQSTNEHQFIFIYSIPANRALGPMTITVRGFNVVTSAQGMIADDAVGTSPSINQAVGTLDGRLGQSHGTQALAPRLEATGILRTPEGVTSIIVNIV